MIHTALRALTLSGGASQVTWGGPVPLGLTARLVRPGRNGWVTGVYVQDSWRLGRVTLNPGVRYERFVMSIPAQSAPAGTWVAARDFARFINRSHSTCSCKS